MMSQLGEVHKFGKVDANCSVLLCAYRMYTLKDARNYVDISLFVEISNYGVKFEKAWSSSTPPPSL